MDHNAFKRRNGKQTFRTGAVAILLVCAAHAPALESVDIHGGLIYIGNPIYEPASQNGAPTGGPSPLLNEFTVSLPFELGSYVRFAVELSIFGTQYGLIPGYPKVVPVEREYANAIWFLGSMIDLTLWLDIPISDRFGLGFTLGPAFLARAPITAWGTGWEQLGTMADYFYGAGRFFYPEAGLFVTYRPEVFESLEISLRARAYVPLFHVWDEENVVFLDQFIISAGIGIRWYPDGEASDEAQGEDRPTETGETSSSDG